MTESELLNPEVLRTVKPLPEPLEALRGVPQGKHHPEGDALEHTIRSVEALATVRSTLGTEGESIPDYVRVAVLCHDLGKATTTKFFDGDYHAYGHEDESIPLIKKLLPDYVIGSIAAEALVAEHMTPFHLMRGNAPLSSYQRLEARLIDAGASLDDLDLVFRCDLMSRGPDHKESLARIKLFADKIEQVTLAALEAPPAPVVLGRHLIERGFKPGVQFGPILQECYKIQVELELADAKEILDIVLGY